MNSARTWFWVLLDIFIFALVLNIVFFVMPALDRLGNSFMPVRTITVSAQGKTTITPDLAESSFSVIAQGKDPQVVANDSNQKMNAVITFLKAQGLTDNDIATTAYDLSPNYTYNKNTQRNDITGYTLTQTVTVKVRDFKKIPDILAGLTPLGINQIGGVNFSVENDEKYLSIARADGFRKAQAKALEMVSENGARLGRVLNVSEAMSPIPYYGYGAMASAKDMAVPAPVAPTIQPGTQDVTDSVTLTYELQ